MGTEEGLIVVSDDSPPPQVTPEVPALEPLTTMERQTAPATPTPPPRPLVSSLDKAQVLMAEARKLRKRRRKAAAAAAAAAATTAGGKGPNGIGAGPKVPSVAATNADTEDDEEEGEGEADREELEELMKELEELDEWRRARCSITTIWPKKYDESDDVELDDDKMEYITALGLRTKRAAADARWEKRVRAKRLRREPSVSPLIVEEDKFDESQQGGPLWDDVSLSLLETELRGGIDLTKGIPSAAAADLAQMKRMGAEGFMEGLGLRPKKRRQISDPSSSAPSMSTTSMRLSPTKVNAHLESSTSTAVSASQNSVDTATEAKPGASVSATSPPVISLDDEDTHALEPNVASTAAAPSSNSDSAVALVGKASKPLFATSTKHDEKMNEFAREFHQSVLRQTQMGRVSPTPSVPRADALKTSQETVSDVDQEIPLDSAKSLFANPVVEENWRKFLDSYAECLKGMRPIPAENLTSKIAEEGRNIEQVARLMKEAVNEAFHDSQLKSDIG